MRTAEADANYLAVKADVLKELAEDWMHTDQL